MTITTATAEDAALSLDRFSMNDDPLSAAAAARSQTPGNAGRPVQSTSYYAHSSLAATGVRVAAIVKDRRDFR
jgi:hypothetical protein